MEVEEGLFGPITNRRTRDDGVSYRPSNSNIIVILLFRIHPSVSRSGRASPHLGSHWEPTHEHAFEV